MAKCCYICNSTAPLDDHHIDCMRGELSPETVPLCRRCHRTYHDLGLEWFEDEFLDKAIELENRRREIIYEIINSKKLTPPYSEISVPYNLRHLSPPLPMVDKAEIVANRSDYWYKKHGLPNPNKEELRKLGIKRRAEKERDMERMADWISPNAQQIKHIPRLGVEPLCGRKWLFKALARARTQPITQTMTIMFDGKEVGGFDNFTKRGQIRRLMKQTNKTKVVLKGGK